MAKKDDDQPTTDTTATPDAPGTESATTYDEALEAGYFGTRVAHPGPTEDVTINEAQG